MFSHWYNPNDVEMSIEQKAFLFSQYRKLETLSEQFDDEDHPEDDEDDLLDAILTTANNIIKIIPNDPVALQCKTFALMEGEEYATVLEATASVAGKNIVTFERAYALYKLRRETEALKELNTDPHPTFDMLQLVAQIHYKLGHYAKSAATYEKVFGMADQEDQKEEDDREFEVDDDDRMELCTNMAAAYVNANASNKALQAIDTRFPTTKAYELLFNRACAFIHCKSFAQARQTLEMADVVAKQSMQEEGCSEEEMEQRSMVIQASRAVVDQLCGNEKQAKLGYENVLNVLPRAKNPAVVAQNNIVSLRGDEHVRGSSG